MELGNENELRVIKTVYEADLLNEFISGGRTYIIRDIKRTQKLYSERLLLRNYDTGMFEEVPAREFFVQYGTRMSFPENQWELVRDYKIYFRDRKNPHPWAAYILPENVKIGERLYIDDIIEDILMEKFWNSKYAASDGECVWNGSDIEIDMSLYDRVFLIG
jgi:hypothetical protein